jgi:hypothetical protein
MTRDACAGWAVTALVAGGFALAYAYEAERQRFQRLVGPRTLEPAGPGLVEAHAGEVLLAAAAVCGTAAFFAWHAWPTRTHRRIVAFALAALTIAGAAGVTAFLRWAEAEHNRAATGTPYLPRDIKY